MRSGIDEKGCILFDRAEECKTSIIDYWLSQREWLLARGVERAQGYLFQRPMPISDVIPMLQQLDYRPRAIPVDPRRLQALRQRRRRGGWLPPWLERRVWDHR